jgi:CRP/FNR family transcriptional regulator
MSDASSTTRSRSSLPIIRMSHNENQIDSLPQLRRLTQRDRELLAERARLVSLQAGDTVFAPGLPATSFLLVLAGTILVRQLSAGGREIVLYRVTGGESCILTTACLLAGQPYGAEGIVESPHAQALALPKAVFDQLMADSAEFRSFVFADYASRITALLQVLEEVAFERIDKRLAHKLLELAGPGNRVQATHQELAVEVGSAREVVSRQLNEFQRRGWLRLARGQVVVTARAELERLATGG